MFFRPCPRGASGAGGPIPSSTTRNTTCVGHDHLDVDACRLRVTGDVAERLAQRREELGGEVVVDAAVDRSVEEAARLEPERAGGLATERQHPVAQTARTTTRDDFEAEDGRTDVLHREVEVVDGRLDRASTAASASVRTSRAVPCSDRPVANRRWMTVSCRSRAMRSRSSTSASSWTRACRRAFSMATAGRGREADHELLVDVGEHLGGRLVGQVEVAEDLVAHPDRHAQERSHRRVVGREAEAVGVLAQVGQPQRLGVDDEQAEDPVPLGQVADELACVASSIPTVMNCARRVPVSSSTPSAP